MIAFGVIVAAAAALGIGVGAAWYLDRRPREGPWLVGVIFVWTCGVGLVASWMGLGFSGHDHSSAGPWYWMTQAIVVTMILLPMIVMAWNQKGFDCPSDGLVYSLASALGSSAGLFVAGQGTTRFDETAAAAIAISGLGILIGGGIFGYLSLVRRTVSRFLIVVLGVLLACGLWMLRQMLLASFAPQIAGWLPISVFGVGVLFTVATYVCERVVLRRIVDEEIGLGILPEWTRDVMPSFWKRVLGGWWQDRRERTVINRTISCLGFRKRALADLAELTHDISWLEIVLLRKEIRQMLTAPKDDDRR